MTKSLDERRDEQEAARIDASLARVEGKLAELLALIRPPVPEPSWPLGLVKDDDDA